MGMRTLTVSSWLTLAGMLLSQSAAAQTEPQGGYFTTSDGVELHYLEAGSGPTIVFVPGFTFPAEVWEPQLTHFARNHRVVALDPRSQGRSGKPTHGHHQLRRGKDIGELIEHLGAGPAVVVGWSLAVREILTYAKEFGTDAFRGIVLVDMTLGTDVPLGEPHPSEPGWRRWMVGLQLDREEFTRAWVRGMYRSEQPDEYLEAITEAVLATPTNSAVTLLANLMLIEERDLRPVLDTLDLPVLYVASSQQWAISEAEMARERWPEMHVEILEGTGHTLFVDEPERFNQVLEEFLATVPDSPNLVSEIEKELFALEDAWALAVQQGDTETLDLIIGDDYVGTTASGNLQNKDDYLAAFLSGARKTYSLTTEDLRLKVYGNTAVITHGGHAEGVVGDQSTSGDYRWTHALVKREGR